jgi:hypothetical protein
MLELVIFCSVFLNNKMFNHDGLNHASYGIDHGSCSAQGPEDQEDDGMVASSFPDGWKKLKNL